MLPSLEESGEAPTRSRDAIWWAVAGLTALTLALGVWRIGHKPLDHDEAWTYEMAVTGWSSFWHQIRVTEAPLGLDYLLVRLWSYVAGTGTGALRLPSALFLAGTVPIIYDIGQKVTGRIGGLVAAALFVGNGFAIFYAQVARPYSLMMLLTAASVALFLRIVYDGSTSLVPAWIVVTSLAVYAHFYSGFVFLAEVLWLIAAAPRPVPRRLVRAGAVVALVSAPLSIWMLATNIPPFASQRVDCPPQLCPAPTVHAVGVYLTGIAGDGTVILWLATAIPIAIGVVMAVQAVRRRSPEPDPRPLLLLGLWWTLPLLIGVGFSLVGTSIVTRRYLTVCIAPWVVLTASGLTRLRSNAIRWAWLSVILAIGVVAVGHEYVKQNEEDYRAAAAVLAANAQPGDGLIVQPHIRMGLRYYLFRDHAAARLQPLDPQAPLIEPSVAAYPAGPEEATLSDPVAEAPRGDIWDVCKSPCRLSTTLRFQGATFQAAADHRVHGLEVLLLVPTAG